MNVELTLRSVALIASEQREHGAVSPEVLIEQALETYVERIAKPEWFYADADSREALLQEGLSDLEEGRNYAADVVLREMGSITRGE